MKARDTLMFFNRRKMRAREREEERDKERERKINRWRPRINPGLISNQSNPALLYAAPLLFFYLAVFYPLFVFIWCICDWKRSSVYSSLSSPALRVKILHMFKTRVQRWELKHCLLIFESSPFNIKQCWYALECRDGEVDRQCY